MTKYCDVFSIQEILRMTQILKMKKKNDCRAISKSSQTTLALLSVDPVRLFLSLSLGPVFRRKPLLVAVLAVPATARMVISSSPLRF